LVVSHDSNYYITEPNTGSTVKHLVEQPSVWSSIISEIPLLPIGTNSGDSITSYDHIPEAALLPSPGTHDDTVSEWSIIPSVPPSPVESDWSFFGSIPNSCTVPPSVLSLDLDIPAGSLRCELCPLDRVFDTISAFQNHIMSAAHSPKIFHCPSIFVPKDALGNQKQKLKSFSTLSGLTQHLESGACQGKLETFRRAIRYVEDQLRLLGMPSVKLLIQ